MQNEEKTKTQLIQELAQLREQIRELKLSGEKSEAKLKEVQRIAQLGHWELDLVNNTLFWSDEIYRIFELAIQEFEPSYETFLRMVHPADRELVNTAYWDSVKRKTPYDNIHRLLLDHGKVKYVHERGHTEYAADGTPLRSIGTVLDITERKQIENALRESEQRFRGAFAHAAFGMAIVSEDGHFIEVNRSLCQMFGYSEQELLTKNFKDVTHPDDLQKGIRLWQELRSGRCNHGYLEKRYVHKNGDTIWTILSTSAVRDAQGQLVCLVSQIQDITERKRVEEALHKSQEWLEKTFASLNDALFVVDTTTRTIIACNPAVERIFGYAEHEVVGRNTEFLHINREMYAEFGRQLFPALDAAGLFHSEFQMRRKDGSTFFSEHTVTEIVDDAGHRTGAVSVVRDITARKQIEAELTQYRQQLEKLVEARTAELQKEIVERKRAEEEAKNIAKFPVENPNPVMRIAKDGTILYANASSNCLLAVWGCEVNQLLPEDWRKCAQEVFHSQTSRVIEVECEDRIFSLTVARVRDAGYVNVYGHDITERKQAEKDLRYAKEALEAANRRLEERVQEELKKREKQQQLLIQRSKLESLGKLAAGIAHEINQPLAGISMGLDNIALKLSSGKFSEEYLRPKIEVLFQHIERIKHIIDHIRTFSREQAFVEIERVDVNTVCRNAVSLLQTQYQQHNVKFTLNLDDTLGFFIGNGYKLEQVLLNLLTNAKDAVDAKEQANVSAAYQKQISLITCCDDDRIYLEVQDNGMGISEEDMNNIFDPFFTTKDPVHGTGLGLSVSYGIIKEMQGDIRVQSQLGEYTRMTISLPRVKNYMD